MDAAQSELRVAVVEDQPLFRSMLTGLLEQQPGITVVAAAGSITEATVSIRAGVADVAVLDVQLPDGNGVELGVALRRVDPAIGILLLSSQDVMDVLLGMPPAASEGWCYLSKTSSTSVTTLVRALRASAERRTMLDPALVSRATPRAGSVLESLTPRQLRVLRLLADGLSNGAMAAELGISPHSVDNLLNGVYSALGLGSDDSRNRRVSAVLALIRETSRTPAL